MKLIGLSSYVSENKQHLNDPYVKAFYDHGKLIPVIIPVMESSNREYPTPAVSQIYKEWAAEIAERLDALVLTGGSDLNPLNFVDYNYSSYGCDSNRDLSEIHLLHAFLEAKKPVMGICRGFQLMGRMFGLTIFQQDIGKTGELHNTTNYDIKSRKELAHPIYIFGEYKKYLKDIGILTTEEESIVTVNSFHHQGFSLNEKMSDVKYPMIENIIEDTAKENEIDIIATTDSIIEGFQIRDKNCFAVQWHPEEFGPNSLAIRYFKDSFMGIK